LVFDIASIDIIYNPDYVRIRRGYKIPVFFKSGYDLSEGFLDNGRHKVPLIIKEEETLFGDIDRDNYGHGAKKLGPTCKETQSISDRLKL
jgi:hypothetical protein